MNYPYAVVDTDGNAVPIMSNEAIKVTKSVAFDGSSGNGAVGTVNLFTVTGDCLVQLIAVCSETLAGATATISVGVTGNTGGILALTTATTIANNDVFLTGSAPVGVGSLPDPFIVANGLDIFATVATANITDGTLKFYAQYRPLSSDGLVVAA